MVSGKKKVKEKKMNLPAPLNLKTTNDASKSWKSFKQSWQIYEIAKGTAIRRNQLSDLQLFYMLLAQMPWKSTMDLNLKVKKRELI